MSHSRHESMLAATEVVQSGATQMLIVTSPQIAMGIADPDVRRLVWTRFNQITEGEIYDYDRHGEMIVVEPGDSVAALVEESGCPILTNPYDDTRFGDPHFTPVFEAIEDHVCCYEVVAILNDDGFEATTESSPPGSIRKCRPLSKGVLYRPKRRS